MRKVVVPWVLIAAMGAGGCYRHTFVNPQYQPQARPSLDQWYHSLLGGLVKVSDDVNLSAVCPQGVAIVEDYLSFLNWLVGALTFSIYTPTHVEVWCAATMPVMVVAPPVESNPALAPPPM